MRHSLTILFFLLPACSFAQNFVVDNILFWDSVEWERTEVVYHYPHTEAVPWIIRRYHGERRAVREEFVRLDNRNWLYNTYDSAGAWRRRTGRMTIDTLHPQIDSILTFDPETYDEATRVDTTWRLLAEGIWEETDTAGFFWSGPYAAGKRQGRWNRWRSLTRDIQDRRSVDYENGVALLETQHNLALAGDTAAVRAALQGSWTFCRNKRAQFWWYRWRAKPDYACNDHHGSTTYFFMENGAVQACFPAGSAQMRVETGVWHLSEHLDLTIDWDDGKKTHLHVRSLIGDELIME